MDMQKRAREQFVVKHYASDERPCIKGNGFDGLEIGEDREEAQRFIDWINSALAAQPAEPVAKVIKRGPERTWMSERLGSLPDGSYSLYLAAPQQASTNMGGSDQGASECPPESRLTTSESSPSRPSTQEPVDPMDTPIPCDVKVGHINIRKGCPLRTVVTRMQVLFDVAHGKYAEASTQAQDAARPEDIAHVGSGKSGKAWAELIAGETTLLMHVKVHRLTKNLVVRFARALAEKLARAETKYGYTDGWANPDWMDECRKKLREHIDKGDPLDVAAYCAFLWHHGVSTTDPMRPIVRATPPSVEDERAAFEAWHKEHYALSSLERDEETGEYERAGVVARWVGWQARAALKGAK